LLIWSALLLGGLLTATAAPSSASASAPSGACADSTGVTVVVDFTELGGEVQTGCASSDFATGLAALESAGFTPANSASGLICAIDAQPDPCPTTFTGSYWSYWHSTATGSWQSYQVGAGSSSPQAGELEGWRYNDGSTGPEATPAAIMQAARASTPVASASHTAAADGSHSPRAGLDPVLLVALGAAAVLIVLVAALLVRSRRRRAASRG
jgi:hypothetical protein